MNTKIEELETRLKELEEQIELLQQNIPGDQLSMVVFSGDLDHLLAAFIIAVGAAAMYERVVMFFTFWGITALRDTEKHVEKAELLAKAFGGMLPKGADRLKLSKMNMAGLGTRMIQHLMRKKGVMSLPDLMKTAADYGVEIVICEMSMNLMGFQKEELIDYPNITKAGVAKFLQEAGKSKVSLFI
jgi:peroxiredoxin family protein